MDISSMIRIIKDFPCDGIVFRDITTLLKDPVGYKATIDQLADTVSDLKIDLVIGIEARGFILGSALAYKLGSGFIPLRKKGKLPGDVISESYDLEYGTDSLEMHKDAIFEGANVLIVDDLLATGGTSQSAGKMVESLGGNLLAYLFLIELMDLGGREKLKGRDVRSLIKY